MCVWKKKTDRPIDRQTFSHARKKGRKNEKIRTASRKE